MPEGHGPSIVEGMKRFLWLAVVICVGAFFGVRVSGQGTTDQINWASPSAMAAQRVGDIGSAQKSPVDSNDMDCYPETYRATSSSTMRSGCFVSTAFGNFDPDTQTIIFNGTDEGVPLLPSSANQVLVPWPKALNVLTLDSAATGGTYVNMYKNPLDEMQDQRDTLGQLVSKTMTAPPEQRVYDEQGRQLTVNSQTLAFSDGGGWMVAETVYGVFVRINLASMKAQAFARAFNRSGSSSPLDAEIAISSNGRFVAIENAYAESFKVYDLQNCSAGSYSSPCPSYEYWGFVKQQLGGQRTIKHIRFINDGLLSFDALPGSGFSGGTYELAPTGSITSLTDYLGLGDSYTSGEGAFDYLSGTDTSNNVCHLSANSYPMLLGHDLFSAAGAHSVACSGAVINDIGSNGDGYRGQVKGGNTWGQLETPPTTQLDTIEANFTPGYVAQHRFVQKYQPRVVTVSVGGNDIGFGNILQNCVIPHFGGHASNNVCYNTYEDRLEVKQLIDRTVPRWEALYRQLLAESPQSRLYIIGYPQILSDTGKCGLDVQLSQSELEFSDEVIAYLNGALMQAASAVGVPFVDISQALVGHRLCEASGSSAAINGLTAGNDVGVLGIGLLGKESYHPNTLGHRLIEQSILQQTNNLTLKTTAASQGNTSQTLLNAPATGRAVQTVEPGSYLAGSTLKLGAQVVAQINGLEFGLLPNSTYTLHFDKTSGPSLATVTTDGTASFSTTLSIPSNAEFGEHTIDVIGPSQTGGTLDISQPVYVSPQTEATIIISSITAKARY